MEMASKQLDSDTILIFKLLLPMLKEGEYYPMVGSDSYVIDNYVLHIYPGSRGIWIEDYDQYSKSQGRYKGIYLIDKLKRMIDRYEGKELISVK